MSSYADILKANECIMIDGALHPVCISDGAVPRIGVWDYYGSVQSISDSTALDRLYCLFGSLFLFVLLILILAAILEIHLGNN